MICKLCKAEIPDDAVFCPECGGKIEIPVAEEPLVKKCPQCGEANSPEAKFCRNDGFNLQDVTATPEATKSAPPLSLVCPSCGLVNVAGAKFCRNDGTPLGGASSGGQKAPISSTGHSPQPPITNDKQALGRWPAGKKWLWLVIALVVLAISGGSGYYLYASGFFGPSSKKAQDTINANFKNQGLNASVVIDKNWVATLQGTIRDGHEKRAMLGLVRSMKKVTKIVDNTMTTWELGVIKNGIAQSAKSIITIKEAIQNNYARQGVVAAQGYDAINRIYGVSTPYLYAVFSISPQGVITATFRNSRIYGRSITLTPDAAFREWVWMSDLDQEYLPFRKGDKITGTPIASFQESQKEMTNIGDKKPITSKVLDNLFSFDKKPDEPQLFRTEIDAKALGDINGDGVDDGAVVICTYGGNGYRLSLTAVIAAPGKPVELESVSLGSYIVLKSAKIEDGTITLRIFTHGPNDTLHNPSVIKVCKFRLSGSRLVNLTPKALENEHQDPYR